MELELACDWCKETGEVKEPGKDSMCQRCKYKDKAEDRHEPLD